MHLSAGPQLLLITEALGACHLLATGAPRVEGTTCAWRVLARCVSASSRSDLGMMAVRALGLSTLVLGVAGHGAVAFPRPRNAIDAETQFGGECYSSANPGGKNGQACFWFNNGCSIGCDRCDGTHNSAGPSNDGTVRKFLYKNMTKAQLRAKNLTIANAFVPAAGDMTLDPTVKPAPAMTSSCGKLAKPTICDPRLRTVRGRSTGHSSHCVCVCVCVCVSPATAAWLSCRPNAQVNSQAECNSPEDIYSQSPVRFHWLLRAWPKLPPRSPGPPPRNCAVESARHSSRDRRVRICRWETARNGARHGAGNFQELVACLRGTGREHPSEDGTTGQVEARLRGRGGVVDPRSVRVPCRFADTAASRFLSL